MSRASGLPRSDRVVEFHRPGFFWTGASSLTAGVLLHLPDYVAARDMHFHMAGMPMTAPMLVGMALIGIGFLLATVGLLPRARAGGQGRPRAAHYQFRAIDDAVLTPAHWGLLFVLGIALIVDVMKPATLGFVLPGMSTEYEISKATGAWLLLCALAGTTLGSVAWGILADRIGRRAAILLASLMFIGTAVCGTMPEFGWNLLMCFLMGAAAGGMLPIVYALMAESVPAHRRGWLIVLHGGMGTVGGTLVAAGCAALLEPHLSWRALWLLNLPTGVLMLVLNRWIPESPRFLLERGRTDEARAVMARYGVVLEESRPTDHAEEMTATASRFGEILTLFRRPFVVQTGVVVAYGLAWGLVNWGFIAFLPTLLQDAGVGAGRASFLLFLSALVAIPGTVLVAFAYGMWSSRKSMVAYAVATVVSLLGLAALDDYRTNQVALVGLLGLLFAASGGVIAMLSPYTAEVYPTRLRGTGSGLSAGSSKLGGLLGGIASVAGLIGTAAGMLGPAVAVSIPMLLAGVFVAARGIETRGRRLEEIAARPTAPVGHAAP